MGLFDGFTNDEEDDADKNAERIKNNERELNNVRGHLESHPYDNDAQNRMGELEDRIEFLRERRDEILRSEAENCDCHENEDSTDYGMGDYEDSDNEESNNEDSDNEESNNEDSDNYMVGGDADVSISSDQNEKKHASLENGDSWGDIWDERDRNTP